MLLQFASLPAVVLAWLSRLLPEQTLPFESPLEPLDLLLPTADFFAEHLDELFLDCSSHFLNSLVLVEHPAPLFSLPLPLAVAGVVQSLNSGLPVALSVLHFASLLPLFVALAWLCLLLSVPCFSAGLPSEFLVVPYPVLTRQKPVLNLLHRALTLPQPAHDEHYLRQLPPRLPQVPTARGRLPPSPFVA